MKMITFIPSTIPYTARCIFTRYYRTRDGEAGDGGKGRMGRIVNISWDLHLPLCMQQFEEKYRLFSRTLYFFRMPIKWYHRKAFPDMPIFFLLATCNPFSSYLINKKKGGEWVLYTRHHFNFVWETVEAILDIQTLTESLYKVHPLTFINHQQDSKIGVSSYLRAH